MRQQVSLLLNLLVVLGLTLSSVLVASPFSAGTGQARVSAPTVSSEAAGDPALTSKRANRTRDQRHDRRDRKQDRQQDRAKTDRKRDDKQKDRQQDRKRASQSLEQEGRVGDWQEHCSGPETIQLRQTELCTHGPDEAPAGFAISEPVPLLSDEAAAEQAATIACDGDGQSGYRTQVLYVRGFDRPESFCTASGPCERPAGAHLPARRLCRAAARGHRLQPHAGPDIQFVAVAYAG